jgi:hypothetical protein
MDHDKFLKKAKELAAKDYNFAAGTHNPHITTDEVFVVWFAKVLGHWKAMVSTDVISGLYWEVTYNGVKKETYVDRYTKVSNHAIPDL